MDVYTQSRHPKQKGQAHTYHTHKVLSSMCLCVDAVCVSEGGEGEWKGAAVVQGITHRLDKGTSGVWMYAKVGPCSFGYLKRFESLKRVSNRV